MSEKLKKLNRSRVKFLGFEFATKPFIIGLGVGLGILILLIALTIFGVNISWYGVLFGMGFLIALVLAPQLCKSSGIDSEFPFTLIWFVFPCSILGARIYYLAFNGGIASFAQIFKIWEGGLAIYGGVIGGLLGLIACCLWKKVSIVGMTDVAVQLVALGQAFGRIGCIFGKCCYGNVVTRKALQWFPIAINVNGDYHYATNFYEAVFDLGLFFGLNYLLRKVKLKGITTCAYLVGYGLVRFILETFRANEQTLYIGSYPVSKLVSIICILTGAAGIITILVVNNRKKEQVKE